MTPKQIDINAINVICVLKDNYGAFVYTNKTILEHFPAPTGGFDGKTDYHLMEDKYAAIVRANDRYVLDSGNELKTIEWVQTSVKREAYLVRKFRIEVEGKMLLAVLGQNVGDVEDQLELRAAEADAYIMPIENDLRKRLKEIAIEFWVFGPACGWI